MQFSTKTLKSIFMILLGQFIISKIIVNWLGYGLLLAVFSFGPFLAIVSHTRCQFTDPGTVPMNMLVCINDWIIKYSLYIRLLN